MEEKNLSDVRISIRYMIADPIQFIAIYRQKTSPSFRIQVPVR